MTDRGVKQGLHPSLTGRQGPRGEIDAYCRAFATARRPAVSWQNLGRMLGVNADDLRRACERAVVVADPAPKPRAPAPTGPQVTIAQKLLRALDQGAEGSPARLSRDLGHASNDLTRELGKLLAQGLVMQAAPRAAYFITAAGRAERASRDGEGGDRG